MYRGYLKLWRKIEDSVSWSRGLEYRGLICSILVRTSRKKTAFRGEDIQPGQFGTVMSTWCEELGLSRQKLQRMSNQLVEDGFISVKNVSNRFSIISVLNWDSYQESKAGGRATTVTTDEPTSGQPVGNHRATTVTTEQEDKNIRTKNKNPYSPQSSREIPPPSTDKDFCGGGGEDSSLAGSREGGTNPRAQGQSPRQQGTNPRNLQPAVVPREGHPQGIVQMNPNSSFEQFWDVWLQATAAAMNRPDGSGKDEGKEAAWLVWAEREKFRQLPGLSDLMDGLMNHSESHQWTKQGGQFIPSAENWLKKGKWADKLPKACEVVQQGGDGPTYNGMRINSVAQGLTAENDAIARRKLEKLRRQQNDGSTVAIGQGQG